MHTYVLLIRGINVGGKSKVPMAELKQCLHEIGFHDALTYIQSGNAIVRSELDAAAVSQRVEAMLAEKFELAHTSTKVLALTGAQLQAVVDSKPPGFGDDPQMYYSDAIFLIDVDVADAMLVFSPREGVDAVWPGNGVIYSQRLGAQRTKSRLSKIVASSLYKSMTIRSWSTITKLLALVKGLDA